MLLFGGFDDVASVTVWKCYFSITFELRFPLGKKQGYNNKTQNIIRSR